MADCTAADRVAQICSHATLSDDEGVALTKDVEYFCRSIAKFIGRNDIVVAMNVSVIELIVVEVVVLLLPRADLRRVANELAMADFAEASDILERKEIGVHRG